MNMYVVQHWTLEHDVEQEGKVATIYLQCSHHMRCIHAAGLPVCVHNVYFDEFNKMLIFKPQIEFHAFLSLSHHLQFINLN